MNGFYFGVVSSVMILTSSITNMVYAEPNATYVYQFDQIAGSKDTAVVKPSVYRHVFINQADAQHYFDRLNQLNPGGAQLIRENGRYIVISHERPFSKSHHPVKINTSDLNFWQQLGQFKLSDLTFLTIPSSTKVATLTIGPALWNGSKTQIVPFEPDLVKTYTSQNGSKIVANGELFLGLHKVINPFWSSEFGFELATNNQVSLTGNIWEDADPDFDNYTYRYTVNDIRVAFRGKLITDYKQLVQPYLTGSIGVGFNHANAFLITPKLYEGVPAPSFTDKTQSVLTYSLGMGIHKNLSPHWTVGMGYEFINLGKSSLGRTPDQTISQGLSTDRLSLNALQFSLSYLS